MKIKLDTLNLVSFDKNNPEHINFLKKIIHDSTIKSRFTGFLVSLNSKSNSIIGKGFFLMDKEIIIGFVDVGNFNIEEKAVYIRGAIDKIMRGKNYGHRMLEEVSNYVFSNFKEVEQIKLKIAKDNISSIKTAESCGFYSNLNDTYIKNNPFLNKTKH